VRAADDPGQGLLSWRDTEVNGPWNSMFLVGGAVAMTDALTEFGFADLMGNAIKSLGIGSSVLPFVAATVVGISTNFISGTALYCTVFIPAAVQIGFNPASMAILIAHLAVGLMFPWAGATAATAFAAGQVQLGQMIKIGTLTTVIFILVVATIHVLLAPFV
jgi:di/tricarboxylate transporter